MASRPITRQEEDRTREALSRTDSITEAARVLGISRRALQHRIEKLPKESRFTAPILPSARPSIEELLERRTAQGERSIAAGDARNLVKIKLHTDGPIGLWLWGDNHLDDDGCNLGLMRRHIELAKHRAIFSLAIGDLHNNWKGRLERLYAYQSTTAAEAWMLVEWFLTSLDHMAIVLGNHDCWTGHGNPIDWIMRHAPGMVEPHGVRIALEHPCGNITRVHARHDFPGRSQYNPTHGQRRELAFGYRDHLLVAGHTHHGADQAIVCGDGMVSQLVRVSSYKWEDDYARQGNFPVSRLHPSALAIVDPGEPDTSRARVWVAPTVETGVKYLTMMRAEYEANTRSKGTRKAGGGNSK
jgi:Bacterial regulatory protein, Fis family